MVETARIRISKWLLAGAGAIAPVYMRRVLGHTMEAVSGLAAEIESGRDGGVMITPWFTSQTGAILAHVQAVSCTEEAARVRAWHEAKEPSP